MMFITSCLLILLLTKVGADECGNRCTSTQICGFEGRCLERSDLVACTSTTSIFTTNYCKKGQACCGDGCMPEGKVCCVVNYCESDHTCCSFIGCCSAGTFCSGFRCVPDQYSTQKPSTATPRLTSKPLTNTSKTTVPTPMSNFPTRTYPSIRSSTEFRTRNSSEWTTKRLNDNTDTGKSTASETKSAFKPWHYAMIAIGVIFVGTVGTLIRIRRKSTFKAKAQSGNRVLNTPTMIHGQGNRNNVTSPSVSVHTHRPPQGMNVYVVRKPSASLQTTVQQQNKGKV
ncbi:uncharacterized protein LOC132716148 isoform X1 [Ruditapes philippinarum]|uniref:uncharacterized protein LOC132716148 isoform X1 n=1 Tax=Ruditapes philippinarum TaxID=129788 RepID=UPI00295B1ED1|nr:uncharacterized protein LOC132716148 isoform X1 [Ruditapes philippinarum]